MPRLDVIDLSHWNAVENWDALAESTILGIIHKSSEGTTYRDADYTARQAEALAREIPWGAYHYLKHGSIQAQMDHFLISANLPSGSRLCIDYEDPDCTLEDLREAIEALRYLDASMQISVYAGALLKEQLGDKHDALLATTSLWLAQYTSGTPTWPKGTWRYWTLWQYSDGQAGGQPRHVPGCTAPIDCNSFNGSPQDCIAWLGPAKPRLEDVLDEPPALGPAVIEMTVPPGTVVRINGQEMIAP